MSLYEFCLQNFKNDHDIPQFAFDFFQWVTGVDLTVFLTKYDLACTDIQKRMLRGYRAGSTLRQVSKLKLQSQQMLSCGLKARVQALSSVRTKYNRLDNFDQVVLAFIKLATLENLKKVQYIDNYCDVYLTKELIMTNIGQAYGI